MGNRDVTRPRSVDKAWQPHRSLPGLPGAEGDCLWGYLLGRLCKQCPSFGKQLWINFISNLQSIISNLYLFIPIVFIFCDYFRFRVFHLYSCVVFVFVLSICFCIVCCRVSCVACLCRVFVFVGIVIMPGKRKCFMTNYGNCEDSGKVLPTAPPRLPSPTRAPNEVAQSRRLSREDHFNVSTYDPNGKITLWVTINVRSQLHALSLQLEEDAENWIYFKEVGGQLKLKPDVLPRPCVPTPQRSVTVKSRVSSSSKKRKRDLNRK